MASAIPAGPPAIDLDVDRKLKAGGSGAEAPDKKASKVESPRFLMHQGPIFYLFKNDTTFTFTFSTTSTHFSVCESSDNPRAVEVIEYQEDISILLQAANKA